MITVVLNINPEWMGEAEATLTSGGLVFRKAGSMIWPTILMKTTNNKYNI